MSGHPLALVEAERALGLDSQSISVLPHPYGYEPDITWAHSRSELERRRRGLLRYVLEHADVVHFNFGSSLFPSKNWDERGTLMRKFAYTVRNAVFGVFEMSDVRRLSEHGIGIVVTFQGDDVRQSSGNRALLLEETGKYGRHSDRYKKARISQWQRYAHAMFAVTPDLLHFLPRSAQFMPTASLDPKEIPPRPQPAQRSFSMERPMRVLHAPSNRATKGTRFVIEGVRALQSEGLPVELILIEGVSNAEAMEIYADADVLVDQLLVGWYGCLAVECMAMGIPALAYIEPTDLVRIPPDMASSMPVMDIRAWNVAETLKSAMSRLERDGQAWARESREFVLTHHDPAHAAKGLVSVYEGAVRAAKDHAKGPWSTRGVDRG